MTLTGIILISPIAVTTGYAASALYGPLMIKLPNAWSDHPLSVRVLHLTCPHSHNEAHILRFGLLYPFCTYTPEIQPLRRNIVVPIDEVLGNHRRLSSACRCAFTHSCLDFPQTTNFTLRPSHIL